jgi:hypothetical protein
MPNEPRFPPTGRIVEIVALPSGQLLDVTGPLQGFRDGKRDGQKSTAPYRVNVVAPGRASVTTSSGLGLRRQSLPPIDSARDTLLAADFVSGCLADR